MPVVRCIAILYIAELQILTGNDVSEYNAVIDGVEATLPHTPGYLIADTLYNSEPHQCSSHYNITIIATAKSTLPPIISAFEYFSVISTANVGSDVQDGKLLYMYPVLVLA